MQPVENIPPNQQNFGAPQKPIDQPINASVPSVFAGNPGQSKFQQIENNIGKSSGEQFLSKAAKFGLESLDSQVVAPLIQRAGKGMQQTITGIVSSIDLATSSITIRGRFGRAIVIYFSGNTQIQVNGKLSSLNDLSVNDNVSILGTKQGRNAFIAKQVINVPSALIEAPEPGKMIPVENELVFSVNTASQTVTVQGANGQFRTIPVTEQTQLFINSQPKRLEDLVPGELLTIELSREVPKVQELTPALNSSSMPSMQKMRGVVMGQDPIEQTVTLQDMNGKAVVVRLVNETQFINGERSNALEQLTIGSVLALIVTKQTEDLFVARKVVNLSTQTQQELVLQAKNDPVGIYLADPQKQMNAARLHRLKGIIVSVNKDNGLMAVHGLDGRRHQVLITNDTWVVVRGQTTGFQNLKPGSLVAAVGVMHNDDYLIAKKVKAN